MREFVFQTRRGRPSWLAIFIPGVVLFAFGVLTLVAPQLIRALFAAMFMTAGLLLAALGWRVRHGNSPWQGLSWLRSFDSRQ